MTDEIRKAIQTLRDVSPQIQEATDEAGRVVQVAEAFLRDFGLPDEVEICSTDPVGDDDDGYTFSSKHLAYCRSGGELCICIVTRSWECDELEDYGFVGRQPEDPRVVNETIVRWNSAPQLDRLEAFPHLPALVKSMAEKAQKAVKATTDAADEMRQLLEAVASDDATTK